MQVGGQMMGTEVVHRSPVRVEVDLVSLLGAGRIHYVLTVAPGGRVPAMTAVIYGAAEDTAPAETIDLQFEDDSAVATLSGRMSRVERLATRPGAMPYINPSAAMIEQALRRARHPGRGAGQVDTVPMFAVQGGSTRPRGDLGRADSAVLGMGGVEMRAHFSAGGDVESLDIPVQNVRFERVEGAHPLQPEKIDYGPPEGAPYAAEDVTVHTPAGLDLMGTLTLPDTSAGPVSAVVTITGSGAEDRDERIPFVHGYRPFWQIADTLGRRGIATLRLDDRGVNGSSPGPTRPPRPTTPTTSGRRWRGCGAAGDRREAHRAGGPQRGRSHRADGRGHRSVPGGHRAPGRAGLHGAAHPGLPVPQRDRARAGLLARRARLRLAKVPSQIAAGAKRSAWLRFFSPTTPCRRPGRSGFPSSSCRGRPTTR